MSEDQGELQPITDEQREAVWKFLFTQLSFHSPELDPDKRVFSYQFRAPTGNLTIRFDVSVGFLDWAVRTSERLVNTVIQSAFDEWIREANLDRKLIAESQTPNEIAGYLAYITMQGIIPKIKSGFYELSLESQQILKALIIRGIETSGVSEMKGIQMPNIAEHKGSKQHLCGPTEEITNGRDKRFLGKAETRPAARDISEAP